MEINLETSFLVPNMFSKVSVSHEAFWSGFLFCLFAFVSKLISFSVQLENKNE